MLQPLDMNEITRSVVATITRRMQDEERIMSVDVNIQPGLPSGYGDPERIQQIMDSLVENAFQYSPENGHLWIRIFQAGQEIQVDIQDSGIGIAPKDQPRIFERFFRGEDPAVLATSGTGLGLSIVKHLVEMHQGRIWFESQGVAGEGSTFSFTLPIYISQQEEAGSGS
jgi:signal transduction histidine kinase